MTGYRIHALVLFAFCGLCVSCQTSSKPYTGRFQGLVTISDIPADADTVHVWLPLPRSDSFQLIDDVKVEPVGRITHDPLYGNETVFIELDGPFEEPVNLKFSYTVKRQEETAAKEDVDEELMRRYLQPDRLGIIDKRIQEISDEVTAGKETTMAKARAIYDHVLAHMDYDKETPGWGRGDTARACEVGKGNCSDYHSLFISLARASDIPARFHYGWALKPEGKAGPHCWAEFYDSDAGWVPVDISEADKAPEKTEYFFGTLSNNRVLLTTGRDIVLEPRQEGPPLNFLIRPYVEVDGRPHDAVEIVGTHET